MTSLEIFGFFTFVVLNTVFTFRAGQESGKWQGIVGTMLFLKEKKCLMPKTSIRDFDTWPEMLQSIYTNPENIK